MKLFRYMGLLLVLSIAEPSAGQLVVTGGAQRSAAKPLAVPEIVLIPTDDFVWHWGERPDRFDPELHGFEFEGTEESFFCNLSGSFERMGGLSMSELANVLATTQYFIQEATLRMNRLFQAGGTGESWATLSCTLPNGTASDEYEQEQLEKALERAERQRERRRARADDDE